MKKQKTNKVKTVVYLIHFILIDIWARNGVLHIFLGAKARPKAPQEVIQHWLQIPLFSPLQNKKAKILLPKGEKKGKNKDKDKGGYKGKGTGKGKDYKG